MAGFGIQLGTSASQGLAMHSEEWLKRQQEWDAIQTHLTTELKKAQYSFRRSKQEFELARRDAVDLGLNTADGSHAIRNASRKYNRTLRVYRIALRRFCDFLLRGKIPPD